MRVVVEGDINAAIALLPDGEVKIFRELGKTVLVCEPYCGVVKKTHKLPRLAALWNEHCGPLPKVLGGSVVRFRKANTRFKEASEEEWIKVITMIAKSPFCCGENDRTWRADFDFLIRPDTRHRVLEGKFGCEVQVPKFTLRG